MPAQLNSTFTGPDAPRKFADRRASRTSSTWPSQPAMLLTASASMSTASTRAPARAKASALARPMPEPAGGDDRGLAGQSLRFHRFLCAVPEWICSRSAAVSLTNNISLAWYHSSYEHTSSHTGQSLPHMSRAGPKVSTR